MISRSGTAFEMATRFVRAFALPAALLNRALNSTRMPFSVVRQSLESRRTSTSI